MTHIHCSKFGNQQKFNPSEFRQIWFDGNNFLNAFEEGLQSSRRLTTLVWISFGNAVRKSFYNSHKDKTMENENKATVW